MRIWCSGNTGLFQSSVASSNLVIRSRSRDREDEGVIAHPIRADNALV